MKSVSQFLDMTAEARVSDLKKTVKAAGKARLVIAKILVAAGIAGDYSEGKMNEYCQEKTGVDIRRELQGTYDAVAVLRGILDGKVPMTEPEWESVLNFAHIKIATILKRYPEAVAEACEIALSKEDVVKRLNALMKRLKGESDKPEETAPGSGEGEGEPSGIQTPAEAPTPLAAFLAWLDDTPLISLPEIRERLLEDIAGSATPACAEKYAAFFGDLKAQAETRWEHLEAEAAAPAAEKAAA